MIMSHTDHNINTSISVIIPYFNAANYIVEAVDSILNQLGNIQASEIIIVNDNSTEKETKSILSILDANDIVTILNNSGKKGSASSRNIGIQAATSEWIVFLDADDLLSKDSFIKRLHALNKFPDAEWIGGDFLTLDENKKFSSRGRFESNLNNYKFLNNAYRSTKSPIKLTKPVVEFLTQTPTNTIVSMVKRSLLIKIGGFDVDLLRQQDVHLFLRLSANADFIFVPENIAIYRLHDNNSTRDLLHTQEWRIRALIKLKKDKIFLPYIKWINRSLYRQYLSNSYLCRERKRFIDAISNAILAIRFNPASMLAWRSLAASLLRRH